jgi:hypothetical protein
MKRTSIFLAEEDRQAIETIKERYGISTDSDAIRLALRVLAESPMLKLKQRGDSHERTNDIC